RVRPAVAVRPVIRTGVAVRPGIAVRVRAGVPLRYARPVIGVGARVYGPRYVGARYVGPRFYGTRYAGRAFGPRAFWGYRGYPRPYGSRDASRGYPYVAGAPAVAPPIDAPPDVAAASYGGFPRRPWIFRAAPPAWLVRALRPYASAYVPEPAPGEP